MFPRRIKDKIMLFFFKLLKNRHLEVLISEENSTSGNYFVGNVQLFVGS